MPGKQMINIGFTGGLESSYTMITLSKYDVEVQPYYLNDNRQSEERELSAIATITEDIRNHRETRCHILPLITLPTADIEKDQEITDAYNRLCEGFHIGEQYEWLARFAKSVDGLCLAFENMHFQTQHGNMNAAFSTYGAVKLQKEGEFEYYVIDPDASSADLLKVFGRFRFPSVNWNKTKREEAEDFKRLGFEHSLASTWFCYRPIDGQPCGRCVPCIEAIENGTAWRFSKVALKRYRRKMQQERIQQGCLALLRTVKRRVTKKNSGV